MGCHQPGQTAAERLPELVEAGIDLVEMMPIADFPGQFGWGYDGVDLFAPTRLYGRPDDLRAFIDAAHGLGFGVILDIVYNHFGPDGLWNDDFHHTMRVAITGRSEAYFSDYRGSPQEIVSTARHGFLYQGQRSRWQDKPRGTPSFEVERSRLIGYIENHDQIANSAWGTRLIEMVAPGRYRAAMTLLMLGPWTPMIFQGQEFGATTPFLYSADHEPDMAEFIAKGRREFLSQFPSISDGEMMQLLAEPGKEDTFVQSRLDSRERRGNLRFSTFFKDLVTLRRSDEVFSLYGKGRIEGAVLSDRASASSLTESWHSPPWVHVRSCGFRRHANVPINSRGAFIALGIPAERGNQRIVERSLSGNPAHRRSHEESPNDLGAPIAHIHEREPAATGGRATFCVGSASFLPAGIPKAVNARRERHRPTMPTQLRTCPPVQAIFPLPKARTAATMSRCWRDGV